MNESLCTSLARQLASMFVNEVRSGRSAYWFCVKLTSVVTELRDRCCPTCRSWPDECVSCVAPFLDYFLYLDNVLLVLAEKSNLADDVLTYGSRDPRFRDLRPYIDLIAKAFTEAAKRHSLSAQTLYQRVGLEEKTTRENSYSLHGIGQGGLGTTPTRETRSGRIVRLREDWRGTRGGVYYYVYEDGVLRRIEQYASSKKLVYESRRGVVIEYEVPLERIRGKTIYVFSYSNNGYLLAYKLAAETLAEPSQISSLFNLEHVVSMKEFPRLSFETRSKRLKLLLREIEKHYIRMIKEVSAYARRLGFNIVFPGHAERVSSFLRNPYEGIIECMALPRDKARSRCLEKPMAWIYQLWIMKLICEVLDVQEIVKEPYDDKPLWRIEQGKPYPAFIARSAAGYYTFWFEFQPHRMAHLAGAFTYKRLHIRPDIVVVRGRYSRADELILSNKRIDLIVECKTSNPGYWEGEVEDQIKEYMRNFKPYALIVASLKTVSRRINVKDISSKNIIVVDGLKPDNGSKVKEFKSIVKRILVDIY